MEEDYWIHTEGAIVEGCPYRGEGGRVLHPAPGEEIFRELLAEEVIRHGVELYLYCVVGRRFHLLFSAAGSRAAAFSHCLVSAFADRLRSRRRGNARRLAVRCRTTREEGDRPLAARSLHLHLFPLREGAVTAPAEHRWSSYRSYIGEESAPAWLHRNRILRRYGRQVDEAQRRYRCDVEGPPSRPGSAASLEELLLSVRRYYRVPSIESRGKEVYPVTLRAREMFVWLAGVQIGAGSAEIAARTGHPRHSAVPRQLRRTAGRLTHDSAFRSQWQREAAAIMSLREEEPS